MALNPLAAPKGSVRKVCEICGQLALIECQLCHVTFWCGSEHEALDREAIHGRVCEFLGPLRRTAVSTGTDKDREHHRHLQNQRKQHLMRLTLLEAQKLYNQGRHELAIPAALQSVKFTQDVHGLNSPALIPAYVLLGTASLGVGDMKQAERYLTQANWAALKTTDCDSAVMSQLYRALARLYDAKGNYPQALKLLADDVYHSALADGPTSVAAAGGYFLMARIFLTSGDMETTQAMYDRVSSIWQLAAESVLDGSGAALNPAQEAEAAQQLTSIYEFRTQELGEADDKTLNTRLALSAFYAAVSRFDLAQEHIRQAQTVAAERPGIAEVVGSLLGCLWLFFMCTFSSLCVYHRNFPPSSERFPHSRSLKVFSLYRIRALVVALENTPSPFSH
eukprot:m.22933 g.22933  ORF g.22933 m.22933 type:complete len:393 (+) comp4042_c0_seq2:1-1179(+)